MSTKSSKKQVFSLIIKPPLNDLDNRLSIKNNFSFIENSYKIIKNVNSNIQFDLKIKYDFY